MALHHYERFRELSEAAGFTSDLQRAYGCLGSVHAQLGHAAESAAFHALHIGMATSGAAQRLAEELRGDSLMLLGAAEAAGDAFLSGLSLCQQGGAESDRATLLCKLGSSLRAQGRVTAAVYRYQVALALAGECGSAELETVCRFNMAELLAGSEQSDRVEQAVGLLTRLIPELEQRIQHHVDTATFCSAELHERLQRCYTAYMSALVRQGAHADALRHAEAFKQHYLTGLQAGGHPGVPDAPFSSLDAAWPLSRIMDIVDRQQATVIYYYLMPSHIFIWLLRPGAGVVDFYMQGDIAEGWTAQQEVERLVAHMRNMPSEHVHYKYESRALPLRRAPAGLGEVGMGGGGNGGKGRWRDGVEGRDGNGGEGRQSDGGERRQNDEGEGRESDEEDEKRGEGSNGGEGRQSDGGKWSGVGEGKQSDGGERRQSGGERSPSDGGEGKQSDGGGVRQSSEGEGSNVGEGKQSDGGERRLGDEEEGSQSDGGEGKKSDGGEGRESDQEEGNQSIGEEERRSDGEEVRRSAERRLFDLLLSPIQYTINMMKKGEDVIIVPDKQLFPCLIASTANEFGVSLQDKFHITCVPNLYLLDKVYANAHAHTTALCDLHRQQAATRMAGMAHVFKQPNEEQRLNRPNGRHHGWRTAVDRMRSSRLATASCDSFGAVNTEKASETLREHVDVVKKDLRNTMYARTLGTLTTLTCTYTDVTTSSLVVTPFQQLSSTDKVVIMGSPTFPDR